MKKFGLFLIAFALLATLACAQYPTGPNTGKQTTPVSNQYFSVTFNGSIITDTSRSTDNQSSNYAYASMDHDVIQIVIVRFVDHDIAADYTSSDFYANDDTTGGPGAVIDTRSQDTWEGHPFTYTRRLYTDKGVQTSKRTRYIIVNSREVIFVEQIAPAAYADHDEWLDFEYSLRIK